MRSKVKSTLAMLAKVAMHEACERKYPCGFILFQQKRPNELRREHG